MITFLTRDDLHKFQAGPQKHFEENLRGTRNGNVKLCPSVDVDVVADVIETGDGRVGSAGKCLRLGSSCRLFLAFVFRIWVPYAGST